MLHIGPVKQNSSAQIVIIIFLTISLNMCFRWSKEQSHWDSSFEYPEHMFWLKNQKIIFSNTLLSGGQLLDVTLRKGLKPQTQVKRYLVANTNIQIADSKDHFHDQYCFFVLFEDKVMFFDHDS